MGTSADFEAAIAEGATIVPHRHGDIRPALAATLKSATIMDYMNINAAFVGGGNMGGALIRGLIARGMPAKNIRVGEAHQPRRIALADELGVHVTADNREAVTGADVVVLAVKPQDMAAHRAAARRCIRRNASRW